MGGAKPKPTAGIFAQSAGRESPEPAEEPASAQRPAMPRAGLAGAMGSAPPYVPPPSGLAAAQAVASRLALALGVAPTAAPAEAPANAPVDAPAVAVEEDTKDAEAAMDVDSEVASAVETSRNGYTFGKTFNISRYTRVPEAQGLQVRRFPSPWPATTDRASP